MFILLPQAALRGAEIHVSPTGNDANPGTAARPLATVAAAQHAARMWAGREPSERCYCIRALTTCRRPSTSPLRTQASRRRRRFMPRRRAPGQSSAAGERLSLVWRPLGGGVFQAKTPDGLVMDQLFVNGQRQHMARYPNYDPNARQFNGSAADAIAPERVARWADPAGGYIHAMHAALWGDMHWRILGKKNDGSLDYEGGWQNKPAQYHAQEAAFCREHSRRARRAGRMVPGCPGPHAGVPPAGQRGLEDGDDRGGPAATSDRVQRYRNSDPFAFSSYAG